MAGRDDGASVIQGSIKALRGVVTSEDVRSSRTPGAKYHPCACGCGVLCRGQFKNGHQPVKRYRTVGGKRLHVLRAERALGKPLPAQAEVHHVVDKADDSPLVICQDTAYHQLLHQRTRVLKAGGDPNHDLLCSHCKFVKPKEAFYVRGTGPRTGRPINRCKECSNDLRGAYRDLRRRQASQVAL
jgi:hypothetical protein